MSENVEVEVTIGFNSLLAFYASVPEINGEPDYDAAREQALRNARKLFIDWLSNPLNEASFDISDVNKIEE
jgi:hypothetical protein